MNYRIIRLKKYQHFAKVRTISTSLYRENFDIFDSIRKYNKDTVIISLKDDIIYGKDYIGVLLEAMEKNPNNLIKEKNGVVFKPDFFDTKIDKSSKEENYLKYLNVDTTTINNYNFNYKTI